VVNAFSPNYIFCTLLFIVVGQCDQHNYKFRLPSLASGASQSPQLPGDPPKYRLRILISSLLSETNTTRENVCRVEKYSTQHFGASRVSSQNHAILHEGEVSPTICGGLLHKHNVFPSIENLPEKWHVSAGNTNKDATTRIGHFYS
jgi:hypothetical protein